MEKNNQDIERKESLKLNISNEKQIKLNQNNLNTNNINENRDKSFTQSKDLPSQITTAEKSKDKVNIKYRKFTSNKNQPWKIKEISLEELNAYDFLIKLIKASLDPTISNSENLKIKFHVNQKEKIIAAINCKEEWEENFSINKKEEFLKTIISEHKTIKIEYELHDLAKNFNDLANKLDLQNKIIENLFESIKNKDNIKKEITENLRIKIANENSESKMNSEIFKRRYAKILQDYTEKIYETLLNNVRNFQSLQDDLKKINLDQELDFNKFDNFDEMEQNDNDNFEHNEHEEDFDHYGNEGVTYRSSYNMENKDDMISKLIIETRNSLYNK